MTYLSIVIPAYNESQAIKSGKLAQIKEWMNMQSFTSELIVVDDGSLDETADLAEPLVTRLVRRPHAGKAFAIIAGIKHSKGEIVLFTDMDQATPISEANKLLNAISHSSDIAIGSRGFQRSEAPLGRYVLSWGMMALRTPLLGLRFVDTQCGFKAFTRKAAIEILDALQIYNPANVNHILGPCVTSGFDVEFLLVAQRLGFLIKEENVIWNYNQTRRVNLSKEIGRGALDLLKILLFNLIGKYPRIQSKKIPERK